MKRNVKAEWITIAVCILIALLTMLISFGVEEIKSGTLRLQVHDTYLIIPFAIGGPLVFLLIYFLVVPFRLYAHSHTRLTQWIVYLGSAYFIVLITLFSLSSMSTLVIGSLDSGWTIFPPLSAVKDTLIRPEPNVIGKVMMGLQVYCLILSILVTSVRRK